MLDSPPGTVARGDALRALLPWVGLFLGAIAVLAFAIRPFVAGPVAFDGTASVLYFERIVSGERLEAFVNTTPKPLLTVALGLAHGLTGDWRAVTWSTIVVMAAGTALGARLAFRVAGLWAAVLTAAFLVSNRFLLVETAWSHGLPWAFACWAAAGLALTAARPRYATAGLFLMLGALARQETFLLLAVATAAIAALAARHELPRGAPRLLLGWGALPIMLVHDWLLTGDPLWWMRVASISAVGRRTRSVWVVAGILFEIVRTQPLTVAVGAAGVIAIVRAPRGRIPAAGLATLAVVTSALLLVLARLHRQTLFYYLDPIWVAIGLGAAVGVGLLAARAGHAAAARWATHRGGVEPASRLLEVLAGGAIAVVVGAVVLLPLAASSDTMQAIARLVDSAARSDRASAVIRPLIPDTLTGGAAPGPRRRPDPTGFRILVPHTHWARQSVDLRQPLTVVGQIVPDFPARGLIHPGMVVYHDQLLDDPKKVSPAFQGASPATVDGVTFDLVQAGPGATWVWKSADWPPTP